MYDIIVNADVEEWLLFTEIPAFTRKSMFVPVKPTHYLSVLFADLASSCAIGPEKVKTYSLLRF